MLNRPTPCHATPCHEPSQPADSTKPCEEDPFIVDIILRNNRTTPERPYGLFHPDESLHYIKKENIGLIEAMGLAVLPSRLVRELPGVAYNQEVQAQVTQAFVQILRAVGVFKEDEQGKAGWREFLRGIHGEIDE